MVRFLLLTFLLFFTHIAHGQDSLYQQNEQLNFTKKQFIAPSLLFVAGAFSFGNVDRFVTSWRNKNQPNFHTRADDFLSITPIAVAYGLDAFGLPSKNDFWNRSAILGKAELATLAAVYLLKFSTNVSRPNGSDLRSFPSNHSAQAFLAATFISEEYKAQMPWVPYVAYTLAGSVALMRIGNNEHHLSDVLVGAGIGLLSQKIAYWTHQYKWKKCSKTSIKNF